MKSVKRITTVAIVAFAVLVQTPTGDAAIFGQVSTAYTLDKGTNDVGGFVSVFEGSTLLFGQYRRGLMSNTDFGIQGGFIDPEVGDMGLALGADVKFRLMQTDANTPFDLALDPRVAYLNFDSFSLFSFGGSVVISRDYALAQGSLAPYGAFNMRLENVSFDEDLGHVALAAGMQNHINDSDSDFEMSGIAGVRWDVSEMLDILGEVVFDRDIGFTMGLNFKL